MRDETNAAVLSRRLASLSHGQRTVLHRYVLKTGARTHSAEEIPIQPRGEARDFPLSSAQERMWFNHQWSPDQPLYNESFGLRLDGCLDSDRLAKSFDFVMRSHEIFTVTFHAEEGRLIQRPGGCPAPKLIVRDLSDTPAASREPIFEVEWQQMVREPFRLSEGPLFRSELWRLAATEYRLVFAMHHIIFDGWSGAQFFRELFTAYNALCEGRELEPPPPRAQYLDFAVWERKWFEESAARLNEQLDYWKGQLAGDLVPVRLSADRQCLRVGPHRSEREVFICPSEAVDALKQLARDSGATLFMALLAVFHLLLARYSGQDEILVGLPTVNRTRSALSEIIGVFTNMAIFRTANPAGKTFRELLGLVRTTALSAQANQEIPIEQVIRALGLQGSEGRSLVTALFDLQKKPHSLIEVPGLAIQSIDVGNGLAKFDLVLAMEDSGDEIKGILEYDAEKFDPETARAFVRHFCVLMESAASRPDIPAGRLPIAAADELPQMEVRGCETRPVLPWVAGEFRKRAAEKPRAIALASAGRQWTYGEFAAQAGRLGAYLEGRGVAQGEHVAIYLPGGPEALIAQLAVMLAGGVFVPIDPADPPARTEFILRDCEAVAVITTGEFAGRLPADLPAVLLDRDRVAIDRLRPIEARAPESAGEPVYLIYTSGSTGSPKGVVVSHGGLANLVAWHRRAFSVTARDRATQLASIAFDASVWEVWPYLAAGASLHFPPREHMADAARLRDWLVKNRITLSFAPTLVAEELVALEWPAGTALRYLLTGGDRLRNRPTRNLPFQFVNNYGPTENAVVATSGVVSHVVSDADAGRPSIGRPIDNVFLLVLDPNLGPLPRGIPGELAVGGEGLATGYWHRPSLTAEKFVTLPDGRRIYRTGDLCRLKRDGEVEFIGRIDSQVKLRGCRVELGEIESALLEHPGVRDAVAIVRESVVGRPQIIAYFVPSEPAPGSEELRRHLAGMLPGYMSPSHFVPIAAVPRKVNGKVDQKALPPPESAAPAQRTSTPPRMASEKKVAAIWSRILHVPAPLLQDDFFQSGGDSLLATRLVLAIREECGVDVPLARMMARPTIEGLAECLETAAAAANRLPGGVVPLKGGRSSLAPLFLAPPAAGSPACYLALASAFEGERPVYGLEAPGLTRGTPCSDIVLQARCYIQTITAIQPHGPYYLAGWSLGGPVAFEIACQLSAAGEEIAYLALMDAGLPEGGKLPGGLSWTRPMWWALSFPFTERVAWNYATFHTLASWVGVRFPESWSVVFRGGWRGAVRIAGEFFARIWRSLRVFVASVKSLKRYQPRRFEGAVLLFQTASHAGPANGDGVLRDNLRKWSGYVEVHRAPGSHMSLMLDPKTASAFAPQFEATLLEAASVHKER
jgi:amino acid adenylation domain-containing protein